MRAGAREERQSASGEADGGRRITEGRGDASEVEVEGSRQRRTAETETER